jgi:hypothetical protein
VQNVEAFIEWLRAKGLTDQTQLSAYRQLVEEIAAQPSLSAALRVAEEEGKPAKHIANLRAVAGRMAEFESSRTAPARVAVAAAVAAAPGLEVEARQPRAPAAALRNVSDRRKGCICNKRYDLYLDDDFGALARVFGGGIGVGTIVLVRAIGVLGALALAFGLAAMGGLVTILSICMRCEGCRRRVQDLDADERARVHKGRGRVVVLTLVMIVLAVACGAAWWSAVKSPPPQQY